MMASANVNETIFGIKFNAHITIENSIDMTLDSDGDGIPDELENTVSGKLVVSGEMEFNGELDKKDLDLNFDSDTAPIVIGNQNTNNTSPQQTTIKVKSAEIKTTVEVGNNAALETEEMNLNGKTGTTAKLSTNEGSSVTAGQIEMGNAQANFRGPVNVAGNFSTTAESIVEISGQSAKIEVKGTAELFNFNQSGGSTSLFTEVKAKGIFNLDAGSQMKAETFATEPGSVFSLKGSNTVAVIDKLDVSEGETQLTDGTIKVQEVKGTLELAGADMTIGEAQGTSNGITQSNLKTANSVADMLRNHTNIIGNYVQKYGTKDNLSKLNININGTNENQNGKLKVSGSASVDGQLAIKNTGNMKYKVDQTFQLISASKINGSFAELDLPELNNDQEWDLRELYETGTIRVANSGSIPSNETSAVKNTQRIAYVYPNPLMKSTGSGNIFYELDQSQDTYLEIYNIFGKKIESISYSNGTTGAKIGNNLVPISATLIKQLPTGVYFIIVHNNYQTLAKGKFLIK